nr:GspH/FimT family pseudopilin [Novosphingobium sp. FKTRR1]
MHPSRLRHSGFSLVEMLAVLFIMALLAGVAAIALPGDDASLRQEVDRLVARASAARDLAVTSARPVALVVGPAGYALEQRTQASWAPLASDRRGLTRWRSGTTLQAATAGPDARHAATPSRVVFDVLGLADTDATMRLVHGHAQATVRVTRDGRVMADAR